MKKKIRIEIDEEIKYILNKLKEKSDSYIVGGYIRDKFLNLVPKDCDFATSLSLDEMKDIFSDKNRFEIKIISEKLNIVELKYKNKKYEIARFRKDLKYYENRKKFDFVFVDDIYDDLVRRDFTINSFAYNGEDIFYLNENYFEDLKNKKIKFIGETSKRIKEDPFRILRLFRFFSEKSLEKIDANDLKIIKENKNLIWTLPEEMIQSELIKIIRGENYLKTFEIVNEINLFGVNFFISEYCEGYKARLRSIFKCTDKNFLKKLKFSKKIIDSI